MAVALAALFVALGGMGYAAVQIDGANIKSRSVPGKKLEKGAVASTEVKNHSLSEVDFKAGQLPAGAQGAQGAQGAAGPTGSAAGSTILGNTTFSVGGGSGGGGVAPSGQSDGFVGGTQLSPNATMIARDLSFQVEVPESSVGGGQEIVLVVDGQPTQLRCTVGYQASACDSGAATVTVPPASVIFMRLDSHNSSVVGTVRWAFQTLFGG